MKKTKRNLLKILTTSMFVVSFLLVGHMFCLIKSNMKVFATSQILDGSNSLKVEFDINGDGDFSDQVEVDINGDGNLSVQDETSYFNIFSEAWTNANLQNSTESNPVKITLLNNIEIEDIFSIKYNKNIILDLNGYMISGYEGKKYSFNNDKNNSSFTIEDTYNSYNEYGAPKDENRIHEVYDFYTKKNPVKVYGGVLTGGGDGYGGSVIRSNGNLTVSNIIIAGNISNTIINCQNSTTDPLITSTKININNCTFSNNYINYDGSILFFENDSGISEDLTIENTKFFNNCADECCIILNMDFKNGDNALLRNIEIKENKDFICEALFNSEKEANVYTIDGCEISQNDNDTDSEGDLFTIDAAFKVYSKINLMNKIIIEDNFIEVWQGRLESNVYLGEGHYLSVANNDDNIFDGHMGFYLENDYLEVGKEFDLINWSESTLFDDNQRFSSDNPRYYVVEHNGKASLTGTIDVVLETDGGTINSGDFDQYLIGTEQTLPTDITKKGYKFLGWTENAASENPTYVKSVSILGPLDNQENPNRITKTFYANWEEKKSISIDTTAIITQYSNSYVTYEIKGTDKNLANFNIQYKNVNNDSDLSTIPPIDVGEYSVIITRQEDEIFKEFNITIESAIKIEKAQNQWIFGPTITDWFVGQTPNNPTAIVAFGEPKFEYKLENASDETYSQERPTALGNYIMRTTVAGSKNYAGLNAFNNFSIKQLTITWKDYNGEILREDNIEYNSNASYGEPPIRTGTGYTYIFDKWVTEQDGNIEANLSSITDTTVVYADYIEIKLGTLFESKFYESQVWDCQRYPTFPIKNRTIKIADLIPGLDDQMHLIPWPYGDFYVKFNIAYNTVSEIPDRIIKHSIISSVMRLTSCSREDISNAVVVEEVLYNSDGTERQILSDIGLVWALGNKGFLYTAMNGVFPTSGGIGSFISFKGYKSNDIVTYITEEEKPYTKEMIDEYKDIPVDGDNKNASDSTLVIGGTVVNNYCEVIKDIEVTVSYNGQEYIFKTDSNGNFLTDEITINDEINSYVVTLSDGTHGKETFEKSLDEHDVTKSIYVYSSSDNDKKGIHPFEVFIKTNNSLYGNVSIKSLLAVEGTKIVDNGNKLIIGNKTITAMPTQSDEYYSYLFTGWSSYLNNKYIITANFDRSKIKFETPEIDPEDPEDENKVDCGIEIPSGVDEDTIFIVVVKEENQLDEKLVAPMNQEIIKSYNATLLKNGSEVTDYTGDMNVKIATPVEMSNRENLKIVIKDKATGAYVTKLITVSGDYLTFETNSLGDFAITADKVVKIDLFWLWILLAIFGAGFIVLLLLWIFNFKRKVIFVLNGKRVGEAKFKRGEVLNFPLNLARYKWFTDKEETKLLTKQKMGWFGFKIYRNSEYAPNPKNVDVKKSNKKTGNK